MSPSEVESVKRTIRTLGLENKTHFARNDIERLVQELTANRQYDLADKVKSMDPAAISGFLR